jgi:hypothetical protein
LLASMISARDPPLLRIRCEGGSCPAPDVWRPSVVLRL